MVIEIDLFAIKQRIVAILQADAGLYDATGAGGKLRQIEAGSPLMNFRVATESVLPHAWVTNENQMDSMTLRGSIVSNAVTEMEHTVRFRIIIISDKKDGATVEKQLDDFTKMILEDIESDVTLKNGGSPICDLCVPERIYELDQSLSGHTRQGRVITLKCLKTTGAV